MKCALFEALLSLQIFFALVVLGDVGTAVSYGPPYTHLLIESVMGRKGLAQLVLLGFLGVVGLILVSGDVGTATSYDPPYLPTRCPGYTEDQLPGSGLFAAAGNGIWDKGAACGRKYRLRCLSGVKRPCKESSIVVEVVDFCRTDPCPSSIMLSSKAFDAVSRIPNTKINIEYTPI